MEKRRLQKTTRRQYEELLNFIENNRIIINGKMKPSEAHMVSDLWKQFANMINSKAYGPTKTAEQWRKIFNEWKVNTRRKSREITVNMNKTGGGNPPKNNLTDLEKRLLSLLSKIHLGDPEVIDSFCLKNTDSENENPEKQWEENIIIINDETCDINFNTGESSLTEVHEASEEIPLTIENEDIQVSNDIDIMRNETAGKPKRSGERKKGKKHYTTNLENACKLYEQAQKTNYENEKLKGNEMRELTKAIGKITEVYSEVEKMKAKNERGMLKIHYYKIFGSLENFDEWLEI